MLYGVSTSCKLLRCSTHTHSKGSTVHNNAPVSLIISIMNKKVNKELPVNELCTNSQKHVQLQKMYLWFNEQYRHPHKLPETSNHVYSPSPLIRFLIRTSAPLPVLSLSFSASFCLHFCISCQLSHTHNAQRTPNGECVYCGWAAEKTYGLPLHRHPLDTVGACVSVLRVHQVLVNVFQCVFKDDFGMVF